MSARSKKRKLSAAAEPKQLRPSDTSSVPTSARTLAGVGALVVIAGYMFVSTAFTVPANAAHDAVAEVAAPYFDQRWKLFAPQIAQVNTSLEVQAQWFDSDGELVTSDWLDVTDLELAAARGIPVPSRITTSSVNALSSYMSRYADLSDEQQAFVEGDFTTESDDGFGVVPDDELVDELGGEDAAVSRFLRYDHMLARFATAMTEATFDTETERVRWRAVYDRPNDFLQRFDEAPQFEESTETFGWRRAKQLPSAEVAEIYDDVAQRYGGSS